MATPIPGCTNPSGMFKPPPEEQVFSNILLMDLILRNLGTQDHLRAALVSKGWCAASRELLKTKKSRIPMSVRVYYDSPCRLLAQFNAYLNDPSRSNAHTITFNGIHYLEGRNSRLGLVKCHNCLIKDWSDEDKKKSIKKRKLSQLYGHVMTTIKFKYIHLKATLTNSCQFAILVKFILQSRAEEIIELDVGTEDEMGPSNKFFRQYLYTRGQAKRLFPNLEVLGIGSMAFGRNTVYFPFEAPALKKIRHLAYNPSSPRHCRWKDFPHGAVTTLGGQFIDQLGRNQQSVRTAWKFVAEFKPKINRLSFEPPPGVVQDETYSEEHRWDLFQLGRLVSPNLTFLSCSPTIFGFLKQSNDGGISEAHGTNFQNYFPKLQNLHLSGSVGVNILDWLTAVEDYQYFPRLRSVSIYFDYGAFKKPVFGPVNRIKECAFKAVEHLKLQATWEIFLSTRCSLQLFSHIRVLQLSHLGLKCDPTDHTFAEIINSIGNLPFLEAIYCNPEISSLNLDHLFSEEDLNDETVETNSGNEKSGLIFKSLISAHKHFKRIEFERHEPCSRVGYAEKPNVSPERFVVSGRTADLIGRQRPGFIISLRVTTYHKVACTCPLPSGSWANFEHLKPFPSLCPARVLATVFQ